MIAVGNLAPTIQQYAVRVFRASRLVWCERSRWGAVPMKGIVLAGGSGTRLQPLTGVVCKQLLPVYDKPMVYYPLSTLMLAGIREILVISGPRDLPMFQRLLGDGSQWGVALSYVVQTAPRGIAEALILGETFLDGSPAALVLGDNLLYGQGLTEAVRLGASLTEGALIFGHQVRDPRAYGVLDLKDGAVVGIVEKPEHPPSRYAVPGLYFYDARAPELARALKPSARGELEVTDLNRAYLAEGALKVRLLGRGLAWLDMGTAASLHAASAFVATLESRQGLKVGCPEEVAWRQGWLDDEGLLRRASDYANSTYGDYLRGLLDGGMP
jgi:glucose-1-phosphate thymidylyltransferase